MNVSFFHQKPRKRKRKILFSIFGIFLLVATVAVLLNIGTLRRVASASRDGAAAFTRAKAEIEQQNFSEAATQIQNAITKFQDGEREVQKLNELRFLPLAARQLDAVQTILTIGIKTGESVAGLAELASRLSEPLLANGTNLGALTRSQKAVLLADVEASDVTLQAAQKTIQDATRLLDALPRHLLAPPIAVAAATLRTELPRVEQTIVSVTPLLRILPEVLGHGGARRYLFLLQNHNELRPTGGFVGTYGVLELQEGDIVSFTTDNIYNIDKNAQSGNLPRAPEPLKKYLSATTLFLRDANWSPDFRVSAQDILDLYEKETRSGEKFHGVIAITPTLLEVLLDLVGPVTVQGTTFSKENAVSTLQYMVEIGYTSQGVATEDRKDIIGHLSDELLTRLFSLPRERWGRLSDALRSAAGQKDILLYLKDAEAQALLENEDWTGAVPETDGDFLFVVDANLASLKTDDVMRRTISYAIRPQEENGSRTVRATLSVTYKHTGTFDWKTTRYRTYTRIYVPKGSRLVSSSGYLENDKLHGGRDGTVATYDELGKTVFGGFTSIEPGETRTLELVYDLPDGIRGGIEDGNYNLTFEKQPGSRNVDYALDIEGVKRLQSYSANVDGESSGKHFRSSGAFETDLTFLLHY